MGLYTVDASLMEQLAPDVIVTQSLCDVSIWGQRVTGYTGDGDTLGFCW